MNLSSRPGSIREIGLRILAGEEPGFEIKDFLHEFKDRGSIQMLSDAPPDLEEAVADGLRWTAFLQALAVYLASEVNCPPPAWTQPPIQLADPWFASPGLAIRNYLLLSSPGPFRNRNLFIDEDSLHVV
jgi:hypothetical protein